ncbi:hypothetical protein G4B88_023599 [Cannabis sativa]|uniref:Gnk2-homologous domain-containing protein n=1 Tax=Cannabis sativa TaxID=3483 RepID=A0A7J6HVK1_CANSA|nr:hypothetical protein G4B88_023599 [Cannabis sativa]
MKSPHLLTFKNGLKNEAAFGGSLRKYATGQTKAPDFLTIYALVQCTPDLPQQQCINCLDYVYSLIPNCCSGKVGGRVVGPTCSVRYEKYLFYGSPYDPRPPFQTAPTPAPTNNTINNVTEGEKEKDGRERGSRVEYRGLRMAGVRFGRGLGFDFFWVHSMKPGTSGLRKKTFRTT